MKKQNRHVLLLIDNASSHCTIILSNIKIKFYPPNCTSRLQPLDQGIIKAFKVYYKNNLVNKLLDEIEHPSLKKATLLDSIYWVESAWNQVTSKTIINCFTHAGHRSVIPEVTESIQNLAVTDDDEQDEKL
jgi:hypothetical protein